MTLFLTILTNDDSALPFLFLRQTCGRRSFLPFYFDWLLECPSTCIFSPVFFSFGGSRVWTDCVFLSICCYIFTKNLCFYYWMRQLMLFTCSSTPALLTCLTDNSSRTGRPGSSLIRSAPSQFHLQTTNSTPDNRSIPATDQQYLHLSPRGSGFGPGRKEALYGRFGILPDQ